MSAFHKWRERELRSHIREGIARALNTSIIIIQNAVKANLSHHGKQPSHGVSTGSTPGVRTGHMRRSWQAGTPNSVVRKQRIRDPLTPSIMVGSNVKYARIHEYGGTIHAAGKLLTVPLNDMARKMVTRNGGTVRGLPLKFIPAREGKADFNTAGYLVLKHGLTKRGVRAKGKASIPKGAWMFVLKRRVHIPARPYIRPAVRKARPQIVAAFQRLLTFGRAA